ncbi:MAG: DUF4349 domain-containing protein [Cellulomonas sp.]|nr:DUF4349 domain-containing protein [Cellulomonas sp.]MCR6648095.1 DUF4349 domain-containing protein [Cellulomonas sp.]
MTTLSRRLRPSALTWASAAMLVGLLLAGCSASADDAADGGAAPAAVDAGSDSAADESGGKADADGSSSPNEARLVVQTGSVWVEADDPLAAARELATYVERSGGRVDARSESAASADDVATASLTIRVPAAKVSATIQELGELGRVSNVDLRAEDVTDAAQDLDARIHALELSVARMEALMASATTTKDLLDAEAALSSRQGDLESLRSQRARLQGQVSLSTIDVTVSGPGTLPVETAESSGTFLSGLEAGWDALVSTISVTMVVLGAMLPWLVVVGLLGLVVLAVRRRRRTVATTPEREPVTVAAPGTGGDEAPHQD